LTRPPILGIILTLWCAGWSIANVLHGGWNWASWTLAATTLLVAVVTWWMMHTAPSPPIRRASLNEMLAEDDPCGHIHALAEFMARRPVIIHLSEHDDEEPAIECQMCESVISFGYFGKLILAAMQGRN